jgi:hypothetical protein
VFVFDSPERCELPVNHICAFFFFFFSYASHVLDCQQRVFMPSPPPHNKQVVGSLSEGGWKKRRKSMTHVTHHRIRVPFSFCFSWGVVAIDRTLASEQETHQHPPPLRCFSFFSIVTSAKPIPIPLQIEKEQKKNPNYHTHNLTGRRKKAAVLRQTLPDVGKCRLRECNPSPPPSFLFFFVCLLFVLFFIHPLVAIYYLRLTPKTLRACSSSPP